jgi:hypothetical protein
LSKHKNPDSLSECTKHEARARDKRAVARDIFVKFTIVQTQKPGFIVRMHKTWQEQEARGRLQKTFSSNSRLSKHKNPDSLSECTKHEARARDKKAVARDIFVKFTIVQVQKPGFIVRMHKTWQEQEAK